MKTVSALLVWFRASPTVEDSRLRRLEGLRCDDLELTAPSVRVFAGRKKPVAASA
jgi:hypothetical protein